MARQVMWGVGIDLAYIPRFGPLMERHGPRFLNKAYHPEEIAHYHSLTPEKGLQFLASRWAAKEAVTKAFGKRLLFPEITVRRGDEKDPRPQLVVHGDAEKDFLAIGVTPSNRFLSISHDQEYTTAYVSLFREQ